MATDLTNLANKLENALHELNLAGKEGDPNLIEASYKDFTVVSRTCMERISEMGNNPSFITGMEEEGDRNEAMGALGRLTALLTTISSILDHRQPASTVFTFLRMGALAEIFDFDERLTTGEHCVALFRSIERLIKCREECQREGSSTAELDRCLDFLCPALMTFFRRHLSLFKRLRDESEMDILFFEMEQEQNDSMFREFVLQAIEETILIAFVEEEEITTNHQDQDGSSSTTTTTKSVITYAQRVLFTGLYSNIQLVDWMISDMGRTGLDPKFSQTGNRLEITSWTGLIDGNHPIIPPTLVVQERNPHVISHHGIPDDIPAFRDEKIVFCSVGWADQRNFAFKRFPQIELEAITVGDPLTDMELQELQWELESATIDEVKAALTHTLSRGGGKDDDIHDTILRFSMASVSLLDSSTPPPDNL